MPLSITVVIHDGTDLFNALQFIIGLIRFLMKRSNYKCQKSFNFYLLASRLVYMAMTFSF